MPTIPFVVTMLVIALLLGAAASAWLWRVQCRRWVVEAGLKTLAAMRWREFSRFVIEALQAQGFEASRLEPAADRGQKADLLLNRDDQTWLLTCKQGVDYRIDRTMVEDLRQAVRASGASGGILATLGRIEPDARRNAGGIELLDGPMLWTLIDPLLPPSVHKDLVAGARRRMWRAMVLAWIAALVLGLALALLLARHATPDASVSAPSAATPQPASPAATADVPAATSAPAATPDAPAEQLSEDEQRARIERDVGALPGVIEAGWATRSTLVVQLMPDATEAHIDGICSVMERSQALGASRVQLQPAPSTGQPVRFMQCRPY
ncbi:hypothetical protein N799_00390 [Lysobacter arseniciresistens ZS79]|uniref:Restriction endonuclease type IV Mrr domain-containing protein n=1 Tax=Lysobacter arseniciresistens ZS79 TaxID=913325 RepID=A0A0A0F5A4_9GAMM|nr:restriction endonuclease [Lysobacter arseniciresistens]KGM57685.1 hypothetical protein N799_00390 [Lysobacter arseniciresistens ZS79]